MIGSENEDNKYVSTLWQLLQALLLYYLNMNAFRISTKIKKSCTESRLND